MISNDFEFPQLDKLVEWFIDKNVPEDTYSEINLINFINDILIDYKKYNLHK